jgi:hypothetical protein
VFVIDCTTIGTAAPTGTPPTIVVTVGLRCPNFTVMSFMEPSESYSRAGLRGMMPALFPSLARAHVAFFR